MSEIIEDIDYYVAPYETETEFVIQDDIEEHSEEIVLENETESTEIDSENDSETTSSIVVDSTATVELLQSIQHDVHILMFIVLFSFCWSCIRSWRINSLRGCK